MLTDDAYRFAFIYITTVINLFFPFRQTANPCAIDDINIDIVPSANLPVIRI